MGKSVNSKRDITTLDTNLLRRRLVLSNVVIVRLLFRFFNAGPAAQPSPSEPVNIAHVLQKLLVPAEGLVAKSALELCNTGRLMLLRAGLVTVTQFYSAGLFTSKDQCKQVRFQQTIKLLRKLLLTWSCDL